MVSKSSSILMAIGIVAVAAVAIIGLGYAYTASSDNSGNELTASYLTVSQTAYADGFEDNAVVFNTVKNSADTVTFTLDGTADKATGAAIPGIQLAAVSSGTAVVGSGGDKVFELGSNSYTIAKTGMDAMPSYSLKFKVSAGSLDTTHYKFYVLLDGSSTYYAFSGTEITIGTSLTATSATVHLFMAEGGTAPTSAESKPMTNATFTLTAEVVPAA